MEYDAFGMPKPARFDERENSSPRRITGGRCLLLLVGLGLAGLIGFGIQNSEDFLPQPEDELAIRNRIGRHLRDGRLDKALREGERLAIKNPRDGHMILGQLQGLRGQHQGAISHFDKVLDVDPDDYEARLLRANSLGMTKRYREAIRDYDIVLARDGGQATALNNRAYFRALERIDLDDAMTDVEKAIEIEPNNGAFLDTRGYLHYLSSRHEQALIDFDAALERYKMEQVSRQNGRGEELGEVYFHRGLAYKALGKTRLADDDFNRARRLGFAINEFPEPVSRRPPLMKAPPF